MGTWVILEYELQGRKLQNYKSWSLKKYCFSNKYVRSVTFFYGVMDQNQVFSPQERSNMLPCSSGAQGLLLSFAFFLDSRQPRES